MTTISTLQATSALSVLTSASTTSGSSSSAVGSAATATNQVQVSTTSGAVSALGHAALIASLNSQDSQSSDSTGTQSVADTRTLGEENALFRQQAAMTSAEVSDAFYSGKGMQTGRGQIMQITDAVTEYSNDAQGFANSGDTELAEHYENASKGLAAAFANHTLVIQTAADVPGLISGGSVMQYLGNQNSTNTNAVSGGYLMDMDTIQKLSEDSTTNHNSYNVGGITVFFSWPK